MKIQWNVIAQNIISGCTGAMLVMSVAHAQQQAPTIVQEISAHQFNLVDDAGTVCGKWSADKEQVALQMFHDKARTQLVNDGERAILTLIYKTGERTANLSSLDSNELGGSMLLLDAERRGSVGAYSGPKTHNVLIQGAEARVELQDEEKQARVIIGKRRIKRANDRQVEVPVSSIALFDKNGREKWGRH